ncbi:MAG: sigma-70 family RNA polymerase sigma factor [Bryobacteraceae bacterium]
MRSIPIAAVAGVEHDRPADRLYESSMALYGSALERLAAAYEADPDLRRDLLQEIHTALWRSFALFDERCSLRTWIYRVAHNTASSHVARQMRWRAHQWTSLEGAAALACSGNTESSVAGRQMLERLMALVRELRPLDRQVILLYLEGLDGASIAEVTGLSAQAVAGKIHRIKAILGRRFHQGENKNGRK